MRIGKTALILGLTSAAVLAVAGYLSGGRIGILAALAAVAPAYLLQKADDRRKAGQERLILLAATGSELAPPRTQPASPAGYLRADAQIVPFRHRPELPLLRAWLASEQQTGIQLVTGPGGAGKTRVALQLSHEAESDYGWRCYWIRNGQEDQAIEAIRQGSVPVLLVVDYAETCTRLPSLLQAATESPGPSRRILLLARNASEWWDQVINATPAALSDTLAATAEIPLGALTAQDAQHDVFQQALEAFADELETTCPPHARLAPVGPDAVALIIHAAALLAVLDQKTPGSVPTPGPAGDVIGRLLGHEERYWQQSQASYHLSLTPAVLRRVVTVATLIGADDEQAATQMLTSISDLDSPAVRGKAARWLHHLYPIPDTATTEREWIGPLRPDLVGEQLVATTLADQPSLARALLTGLDEHRASQALTLLARAAITRPAADEIIERAIAGDPDHLAVPALGVATETNPALATHISKIVEAANCPLELLNRIIDALPKTSVALAPVAALTLRKRALALDGDAELRARDLLTLSDWLTQLGQREEALSVDEQAVAAYRQLAAARPDAFLPSLAAALNSESVSLGALGRDKEALAAIDEAITIRRQLAAAAARPDEFLPGLATSLNNQSVRLGALGRDEEALAAIEEAITIRRQLAAARPDEFLAGLAMSLSNQSVRLGALGRDEEALAAIDEAITIRRQLAAARPDEFLPGLAMSLNNQSVRLAALGRDEEALAAIDEAITIRRQLAAARPQAFLPGLATSLSNQSVRLAALGRDEEALAAIEEAITIRRQLAAARPDLFLPNLASSLRTMSEALESIGRKTEADLARSEALRLDPTMAPKG